MRIDTNGKGMEAGIYEFKICAYPQTIKAGDYDKYEFQFLLEGFDKPIKQSFFPNQMGSLLKALGFKEVEKGIFDCDVQEAYDRMVKAELYFEEYTKKDGTKGTARKLKNFEPTLNKISPTDIKWED